jgi:hypothetical protein
MTKFCNLFRTSNSTEWSTLFEDLTKSTNKFFNEKILVDFIDLWNSFILKTNFFAMLIISFAFTAQIDLIFSKISQKSTHKNSSKRKFLIIGRFVRKEWPKFHNVHYLLHIRVQSDLPSLKISWTLHKNPFQKKSNFLQIGRFVRSFKYLASSVFW